MELLNELRPVTRGLETVLVSKDDLLKALQGNRDEHRKIFEEAIEAWQAQVIEKLTQMTEAAMKGRDKIELHVGLPRPEDHTKDYERVIRMIEMSKDEEFELTERDFAKYVMDDWGWQRAFLETTANYTPSAFNKFDKQGYNN